MHALLATLLLAAAPAAQLDEAGVRAAYGEALAAVAEVLEERLDPPPPLRFVEASELGRRVAEENLPLVLLRQPELEAAEREADLLGAQFAQFAFAKYSWGSKEFLVVLPSWNGKARQLDRIELIEDETVRAVLVHELVHALDDRTHDLGRALLICTDLDRLQGFNAVLEGHAQHVARSVAAARGWSAGFAAYTELISALPPGLDEGSLQLARIQIATIATAYEDGERFIAALDAAGGRALVARAFRAPPDAQTVFHPHWFIDPATRPAARFDAEPALDLFQARHAADRWNSNRVSLTPAQLSAALALLPPETVKSLCATLRASRLVTLQPSTDPQSKLVVLGVMEFEDEAAARAYLTAARELGRIKDESMRTGSIRILSAAYDELETPDARGFHAHKRLRVGASEIEVTTIDLQSGPLVLETIFSNEPIERAAHVELVRSALAAVKAR